ncbi:PDZ domain-containing protein [Leptospira sp. 2 VSF19]|uniref:PDZ domain-containing protein n=1 Tax=Leptospira soteropolitanensis TaxID=2950025 RepID=A0AAW5VAK8_9LEPT|nr:PDZ domain-containing protein [Leptospira soteropolitanensis]MCW7491282.1 PDZ domain-containing protein [Leptospira soteropolitanensis]MCW7498867.1 PDZ domain-containing protein [Leptospira soteropolitanensis]MCW7521541.1 PDZ domain-containing protein [Leptospira soteropolitanensis]MCW7524970.1 PDZ domain-containing protein [Leptospira soteropolitanensis]MCW7528838.1 PDZ domain-containing protein [Leptospira soteropolitanensis]
MKSFKYVFVILFSFSTLLQLGAEDFEDKRVIESRITFQKTSHQNPWLIGEPFSRKINLIYVGKGLFFGVTLPKQNPVFAEFESFDYSVPKLGIKSYDEETGFILLETNGISKLPKPVVFDSKLTNKHCPTGKSRYVFLPFSKTPIKVFLFEKKTSEEAEFFFKNQVLCGVTIGEYLIPPEYVETFNRTNGKPFPHPGLVFDVNLTPSEREYYSQNINNPLLVTEVIPGVGPAYNLFPGDLITEINSTSLSKIDDWDRADKVYDLILRKSNGTLRELGDSVQLKIRRNFQNQSVSYDLRAYDSNDFLIPEEAKKRKPLYLIAGGFFFTELTNAYLKEFGSEYRVKSEKKLVYLSDYYQKKVHPIREKIVILSRVFPLEGNLGYQEFQDLVLEKVNGTRVTSLSQLKNLLQSEDATYYAFELSGGKIAFFTRKEILDLQQELQSTYKLERSYNLED